MSNKKSSNVCPEPCGPFVVSLKAQHKLDIAMTFMNTSNPNGFMLLFSSTEWYNELSAEELQRLIDQNKAWLDRLITQGKAKGGQGLVRQRAVVSGPSGRVVVDGPFAESKEAVGGYLLLNVETLEEAIAIARSSPNIAHGTSIEIRPLADECPLDARARELARREPAAANA